MTMTKVNQKGKMDVKFQTVSLFLAPKYLTAVKWIPRKHKARHTHQLKTTAKNVLFTHPLDAFRIS